MKFFSFLVLCVMSMNVFAGSQFTLNTLFQTGNKDGNELFTVSNISDQTIYLKTDVVKIQTKNGEIEKIALTRDNFPLWDLAVNPTKLAINPGDVKDVGVKYLCQKDCPRDQDLVYQVRFTPVENALTKGQSVSVQFGMAPYYIVPARVSKVDYDFDYDDKKGIVHVVNKGNTYIKIEMNNCNKINKQKGTQCRAVYNILSGRKKDIILPDVLNDNNTKVTVANYDQSIQKKFNL